MKNLAKCLCLALLVTVMIPVISVLTACGDVNTIYVSTMEGLKTALESDKQTIKLSQDINTTESIYITRKVTFDLNGKTIEASGYDGVFCVSGEGELTITGKGNIIAKEDNDYAMAIWAKENAKVVIENGKFSQNVTGTDSQYDMIYASGAAQITILDGEFESVTPQWTLNLKDADNKVAKMIVKGGKFVGYNPANSLTEPVGVSANFVADGYKSELVEGTQDTYRVVEVK